MYQFICSGNPPHASYSASKEQIDSSCPTCGALTHLIEEESVEKGRLRPNHNLTFEKLGELAMYLRARGYSEASVAYIFRLDATEFRALNVRYLRQMGKQIRIDTDRLHAEGKTNKEIADELGIFESTVYTLLLGKES
jgi:hypothetical protein